MKAVITVGLGFGDEGKGATVDFLARKMAAEIVVRYSGGAQAGHNVQLDDGRRHTFSQFGAGTFAGAKTFLGPRVIISPSTMRPEAAHLRRLDVSDPFALLTVHPDCLVSTGYHVLMNRLRETSRGERRHGSCGLGVGEARQYWLRYGPDAIVAGDLQDRATLVAKLTLVRERMLLEMQEFPRLTQPWCAALQELLPGAEADGLRMEAAELNICRHVPSHCSSAIFEGAQGVLLDEWKGFHPYTTWSTVTPLHALELVAEWGIRDVTVLGITRAFSTRHGAGPFPSWCPRMSAEINDPGNPANDWQGTFRCGPLDLVLLQYAARASQIDGLVVNCLDQLPKQPRLCGRYQDRSRVELPQSQREQAALTKELELARPVFTPTSVDGIVETLNEVAPVVITASGPRSSDRQQLAPTFDTWYHLREPHSVETAAGIASV